MRRMTSNRGLVAAMENEDLQNDTPVDENAVEVAEASAELSDDVAEVADTAAEGEADQAEVEEATDVAEALESIADAVGVAAQNGGLNQHAARAIGIAVQHMYDRVGITSRAMPALESFGSNSQRLSSTQLAMEDIREQAGRIWQAIIDAIKKAYKWAEDLFLKVFGSAEKLAKRAEALQNKAEGITGTAKNKDFENGNLVKRLCINGTVTTAGTVAAVAKIETTAKTSFELAKSFSEKTGADIVEGMQDEAKVKTFATEFKLEPLHGSLAKVSTPESEGFQVPQDNLSLFRSDELPGGMALVARSPEGELKGEAAITAMRFYGSKVEAFKGSKTKAPTATKVPTLATADMLKICKSVKDLADELKAFRNQQSKIKEIKKKFEEAVKKAEKSSNSDEADVKAGYKAVAKVAGQYPRLADQPAASFSVYALNAAKAALDYVDASTKQYGGKD